MVIGEELVVCLIILVLVVVVIVVGKVFSPPDCSLGAMLTPQHVDASDSVVHFAPLHNLDEFGSMRLLLPQNPGIVNAVVHRALAECAKQ